MRGFRGSRAAQNMMARFDNQARFGRFNSYQSVNQQPHHPNDKHHTPLPDWMKTPETRAREAAEARAQIKSQSTASSLHKKNVAHPAPIAKAPIQAKPAVVAKSKPKLSLVQGGKKPAVSASSKVEHKLSATRSRTGPKAGVKARPKRVTAKRKAA